MKRTEKICNGIPLIAGKEHGNLGNIVNKNGETNDYF